MKIGKWCRIPDSNRYGQDPRDFKSLVSTISPTRRMVWDNGIEPLTSDYKSPVFAAKLIPYRYTKRAEDISPTLSCMEA